MNLRALYYGTSRCRKPPESGSAAEGSDSTTRLGSLADLSDRVKVPDYLNVISLWAKCLQPFDINVMNCLQKSAGLAKQNNTDIDKLLPLNPGNDPNHRIFK
jgi:hypothetical protein